MPYPTMWPLTFAYVIQLTYLNSIACVICYAVGHEIHVLTFSHMHLYDDEWDDQYGYDDDMSMEVRPVGDLNPSPAICTCYAI